MTTDGARQGFPAISCDGTHRQLWSLWELMQRFDASAFLEISNYLMQLHQIMQRDRSVNFPVREFETLNRRVAEITEQLKGMELDAAEISAARLLDILGKGKQKDDGTVGFSIDDSNSIEHFSADIVARARDQLQARMLFFIPMSAKDLYAQPRPLFGDDVASKFPSVAYEIDESGKCLALDRSTGSAFHSIRCLEAGIRAISRCLGIPDPTRASDRSWFKLLKAIKDELDRRWPGSSTRLSGDGRFFEEAYAALAAMQNPYRNSTMHLDQKYTVDEARHIFEVVKGFMMKLAARCGEDGEPKA